MAILLEICVSFLVHTFSWFFFYVSIYVSTKSISGLRPLKAIMTTIATKANKESNRTEVFCSISEMML